MLMETTSGVDNDEHKIGEARLGAVAAVSSTTSGTMYFNRFESRRGSYIGPLAYYSPRYAQNNEAQNANVSYQYTSYNLSMPNLAPPMQSGPTFVGADFTYDGDGRRVKSETTTDQGASTTYFVGMHYEVTDGVVTKYYYAGAQRIAMRQDGTLKFILGDHLGSTSLVTDANGYNGIETRYKAWGEVRYASGEMPTKYSFTGQRSYTSDFGLMFYNARWYDLRFQGLRRLLWVRCLITLTLTWKLNTWIYWVSLIYRIICHLKKHFIFTFWLNVCEPASVFPALF